MIWFDETGSLTGNPDMWWPELIPTAEYADFSYDCSTDLVAGDSITALSLTVAPSGPGEAVMSRLAPAQPLLIVAWITGGLAGRTYLYQLTIGTAQGRNIVIMIGQRCAPVLAQYPLIPPPNPAFGGLITWAPV